MADAGSPAPAVPAPQDLQASQALQTPQQPAQQVQHMPQLDWSHFKPQLTVKPEENAEAHLPRMNNWMDTHQFKEGQKFCLTLLGEARLWYESLRPINVDWQGLQNQFKQQYSKIGNTRAQLFHMWWSFHFDEIEETLNSYVMCIRQVATPLGYGEPQILEVFKNTLPTRLYWVLFPIEALRPINSIHEYKR